jgi:uncharacterized cupin superfamily protein
MANLYEPEWDAEADREPYRWKRSRLGLRAGARELGASLFEVPPGASTFPLHAHHNNEELLVVVAGRPTLRSLDGERELAEGEVVSCPMGRQGAHRLDNRTDQPVRVLIVSTMRAPDVNEFPDSGLLWARTFAPGLPAGDGDVEFSGPAGPTDPLGLP